MTVYKNYITFVILGKEVNLISDETEYGINTVVEIDNQYYYLGPTNPDIAVAITMWQKVNGKELSDKEMDQILIDNNHVSSAV